MLHTLPVVDSSQIILRGVIWWRSCHTWRRGNIERCEYYTGHCLPWPLISFWDLYNLLTPDPHTPLWVMEGVFTASKQIQHFHSDRWVLRAALIICTECCIMSGGRGQQPLNFPLSSSVIALRQLWVCMLAVLPLVHPPEKVPMQHHHHFYVSPGLRDNPAWTHPTLRWRKSKTTNPSWLIASYSSSAEGLTCGRHRSTDNPYHLRCKNPCHPGE